MSQPVDRMFEGVCICGCHGQADETRPPAVEARMCRECADERFQSWSAFVEVMMS